MYFARKHTRTSRCLHLVESYRPLGGGSPRHRVVVSLGDADIPAGDRLLERSSGIESALRERIGRHFGLKRTLFLYGLTNFHFEGACRENPAAVRGHSKQKRNDCPQIVVGVVFDEFGFEVLHRTLPGNRSDCRTLPTTAMPPRVRATAAGLPRT